MTDWETRSLQFVVNAIASAEKRQHKLWKQLSAKRTKAGLIPINWPAIEEYIESARRTHALMFDLEQVAREYEAKNRKSGRKKKTGTKKKRRAK